MAVGDVCRGPFESNVLCDAKGNPIGSTLSPGARLLVDTVVSPAPPGTTMASFPFVVVPPGGVVGPFIQPPATQRLTFSVLGTAGDIVLVRAVGSPALTGVPIIAAGGTVTFGAPGGSIVAAGYIFEALATNAAVAHVYPTAEGP
jgi:hypothetical protein